MHFSRNQFLSFLPAFTTIYDNDTTRANFTQSSHRSHRHEQVHRTGKLYMIRYTLQFAIISTVRSMSTIIKPRVIEKTYSCSDGVMLATRHWINFDYDNTSTTTQEDDTRKILCLHGWLDNAASFNRLAPLLLDSTETPTEIVCLDFPGHGLSGVFYFSLLTRVISTWYTYMSFISHILNYSFIFIFCQGTKV